MANSFPSGAVKTCTATIKVTPSGAAMQIEVWMGSNQSTKSATSGKIAFTSTGANQNLVAQVTMPTAAATYHVYIDVFYQGAVVTSYQAIDDIIVTQPGLVITNVVSSAVSDTGTTISWDLSDYGTGQVEYGPTVAYGSLSAPENSFTYKHHDQVLSGLTKGTLYHFRVRSKNQAGVETISVDYTFTTTGTSPGSYELEFLIDHTKIQAPLINFPVKISLNASSNIFDVLGTNRKKIGVFMSDGTQCYVEISYWDAVSKLAVLWVGVPSVSSTIDTALSLVYDPLAVDNTTYVGDTGSAPAKAVWDANFVGVWHLVELGNGTAGEYKDSTSRAHHGQGGGGTRTPTVADIGQHFAAASRQYISVPDHSDFSIPTSGSLTVSAILSPSVANFATEYVRPIGKASNGQVEWHFAIYSQNSTRPQRLSFYVGNLAGGLEAGDYTESPIVVNDLVLVTATTSVASGREEIYRDDAQRVNGNADGDTWSSYGVTPRDGTSKFLIGQGLFENGDFFEGRIAEVRISNIKRSLAWIAADNASVKNQLLLVGSAPPPPSSGLQFSAYLNYSLSPSTPLDGVTFGIAEVIYPDASMNWSRLADGSPLSNVTATAQRCHAAGIPCIVSLFGGYGDSGYNSVYTDPTLRQTMLNNLAGLKALGVDGIDWDWECDSLSSGQGIAPQKTAFMQSVRAIFGPDAIITITQNWPHGSAQVTYEPAVLNYVNFVQIMCYDDSSIVYMTVNEITTAVNLWTGKGFPKASLIIGIPFQTYTAINSGSWNGSYSSVIANYNPSPAANNAGGAYYNGHDLVLQKAQWVKAQGLGGCFAYNYAADAFGDSRSLSAAIRQGMA